MIPKTTLAQVADGLWTVSVPFRTMGLALNGRTNVVRLADGGLLIHSPARLSDEVWEAVAALGPVRALVAANKMHHLAFGDAAGRFSSAAKLAAPGLADKRKDLAFDGVLGDDGVLGLLSLHVRGAPAIEEVALLHAPSRTLLLVDLLFHFPEAPGFFTRTYLRANGALGRPAHTAVIKLAVRDKAAARASVEQLLAWDFDRVLLAHDTLVETGGKEALRHAFRWLLG